MGTNYYRIPTEEEMEQRRYKLLRTMIDMKFTPRIIDRGMAIETHSVSDTGDPTYETRSPWDDFIDGTSVHLGKRSSGWKFCWNFHNNKYYSNKSELLEFIHGGRVMDEYGELCSPDDFINMALEWGEPDGYSYNQDYLDNHPTQRSSWMINESDHFDIIIDGLRVSKSCEFS